MNNAGLVSLPENIPFVGPPRPEHETAWEDLLSGNITYHAFFTARFRVLSQRPYIGFNVRISQKEVAGAPFESYELRDGSGDLWATPYVFHNLHCLVSLSLHIFCHKHRP